jgi:hypothetical protein
VGVESGEAVTVNRTPKQPMWSCLPGAVVPGACRLVVVAWWSGGGAGRLGLGHSGSGRAGRCRGAAAGGGANRGGAWRRPAAGLGLAGWGAGGWGWAAAGG